MITADSSYSQWLVSLFHNPHHRINLHGKLHFFQDLSSLNKSERNNTMDTLNPIHLISSSDEDSMATTEEIIDVVHTLQLQTCPPVIIEMKKWIYSCLKSEVCCDTGCCVNEYKTLTQFWYAWFIITILGAFLLGCFHYYKKQKMRVMHAQQQATRRHASRLQQQHLLNEHVMHVHPPGNVENGYINFLRQYNHNSSDLRQSVDAEAAHAWTPRVNDDYHDQLMDRVLACVREQRSAYNNVLQAGLHEIQSCRSARRQPLQCGLPPPSYDALVMNRNAAEDEPPPVYHEACKLIAENENRRIQTENNDENGPERSCNVNNVDCNGPTQI